MSFTGLLSIISLASAVLAGPTPRAPLRELKKVEGEKSGRYIVVLKDGVSTSDVHASLSSAVTHQWSIIPGFAVEGSDETLEALLAHPDVASVEEDGYMYTQATQTDATWGIARLSADGALGSTNVNGEYTYTYDDSAGEGVDVYVIDTGINTSHEEFEGRASWGETFGGYADADGNGHGTHCAGTIASAAYGVAKKASVIAVKVLSDAGSGTFSDVISGINYAAESAASTGKPSVASMSLGGSASSSVDSAVAALTSSGVHIAVAAGNSNTDAGSTSPARAPSALTVGATTISDARASYSNYGSVVDIWAPGTSITSTWIGSNTATNQISGTSMATPHIAGLVAYIIAKDGNDTPANLATKIKASPYSQSGVITGIPSGTVNLFAHNGE